MFIASNKKMGLFLYIITTLFYHRILTLSPAGISREGLDGTGHTTSCEPWQGHSLGCELFAHTNLPRAGFELETFVPQDAMLPI